MPALNVTAGSVLAANANTLKASATAGTAITAGRVVYLDTNSLLWPASGTVQIQAQTVAGIALNTAQGSGEPVTYAASGDVILPTSGTVLVSGSVYVLGTATPGDIVSANDLTAGTTTFVSLLGLATSPTNLRLSIAPLGVPR